MQTFDYNRAFSRNIGWITEHEQSTLRGKQWSAPHGIQYDGYRNKFAHTWRPGGNRNPINRLAIAKHQLGL